MLSVTNCKANANQNRNEILSYTFPSNLPPKKDKCWQECEEIETSVNYWWECKMT